VDVPEPGPKLKIVGKTAAAQCRIAEAGHYTYIEQNTTKKSPGLGCQSRDMKSGGNSTKTAIRSYSGQVLIDGELYTVAEAKTAFGVK
jgi:hypothetical protein